MECLYFSFQVLDISNRVWYNIWYRADIWLACKNWILQTLYINGDLIMNFTNQYLTNEEKQAFAEAKITDPRWNLPKYYLIPFKWTVDKERNIALVNCGIADRECSEIKTFAFLNTNPEKKQILSFQMVNFYLSQTEEEILKKKYNVNLILNWKVIKIVNLKKSNIFSSYEEFVMLLSEALSAYGVNGNPEFISNVKAFIKLDKCVLS